MFIFREGDYFLIKKERQDTILALIDEHEYLTISELSARLNVSSMTVRRDTTELEKQNKVVKLYGGIQKIKKQNYERDTEEKIVLNFEEKNYIGQVMNELIPDNSVIYLGAGTTIYLALKQLTKKGLTVITNSLITFTYLINNSDYKVILTGGDFNPRTEEFIGNVAEQAFEHFNIDLAFAATNGIYANNITTSSLVEGNVQVKAFEHSKTKIIVADHSKFNVSDVYTFYKLTDLDYIITDNKITNESFDYYNQLTTLLNKAPE